MLNIIPLGFASGMALIDTMVLSWLKCYHIGTLTWRGILPFAMVLYSLQPLIFLHSLNYENMTIMNILWDVISDIFVTTMGLFYFKETLSTIKMVGLSFAFIAIVLLSYDEIHN